MLDYLYFKSFLLGIVQGFTEFLPISSTAHLFISIELLKIELNDFIKSFVIIIQLGSILAVVFLYWKKIIKNFNVYFKKILVAFFPTAIISLSLYSLVKNVFQESFLVISLALFFGGILIIKLENFYSKKQKEIATNLDWTKELTYKKCFLIGIFQAIAIIPGVSRSAATIFGGLSLGISRKSIVEFSFLLAIPTMLAASGFEIINSGLSFNKEEYLFLIIGFIFSFLVAILSIKLLLNYIKKNNFKIFAWYRILVGLLVYLFWVL